MLDANENAYGPGLEISAEGRLSNGAIDGHIDQAAAKFDLLGLNRYPDPSAH